MEIRKFLYETFMHPAPKVDKERVALLEVLSEKMGLTYEKGKIIKDEGDLRGRFTIETGTKDKPRKEMYQIEDLPYLPDSEITKILQALEEGRYAIPVINKKMDGTFVAQVLIGKNVNKDLKDVYTGAARIAGKIITQEQRDENKILNDTESVFNTVMEKMVFGKNEKRPEEALGKTLDNEPKTDMEVVVKRTKSEEKESLLSKSEPRSGTTLEEEVAKQQKKKADLKLQQELDEKAQTIREEAQEFDETKSQMRQDDIQKV